MLKICVVIIFLWWDSLILFMDYVLVEEFLLVVEIFGRWFGYYVFWECGRCCVVWDLFCIDYVCD